MRIYVKVVLTVVLMAAFMLLSGFRAQTIIHDDGSETQDVLKVSDTAEGQKALRTDADDFQKRNYTIMDYNNNNGTGFRAMKTITKDGASKSSVDRIVHKTHDGLICSTYYIDFKYDADSLQNLRLGMAMPENGADLEYIISFPAGTNVQSNSTKADDQGSTYMWSLSNSNPTEIKLQATVWHKLFIYIALFLIVALLLIVVFMEHRRKNVISWKRAAHMRKIEMTLLCIPILILGYMGYEYYVGTHVTDAALEQVQEQQQEELLESREEDKRLQDASSQKKRLGEMAASKIRNETSQISNELRTLNRSYLDGEISQGTARSEARRLASQAQQLMNSGNDLSQADRDVLQQLVDRLIEEADSIGSGPTISRGTSDQSASAEQQKADQMAADEVKAEEREAEREAQQAEREAEAATDNSAEAASSDSSAKSSKSESNSSTKSNGKMQNNF